MKPASEQALSYLAPSVLLGGFPTHQKQKTVNSGGRKLVLEKPLHHPRYLHSDHYYLSVLHVLTEGLKTFKSDQGIADLLNEKGLLAPSGNPWTAGRVTDALYNLRKRQSRPNRLYAALVRFVFEGRMAAADYLILFSKRQPLMAH